VDRIQKFIEVVTLNSLFTGLLNLYLFASRLFKKNPSLEKELDKGWQLFLRIMDRTLQTDVSLWKEVQFALERR
jgi:uncharacterized protein YjaG (DUF416 family)